MNGRDGLVDSIEGAVPGDCSPLVKLPAAPAARALAIVISLAFLFLDGMDGCPRGSKASSCCARLVDSIEGMASMLRL